jgi:peptide/nickel transport system substrate-binding protein
MEMHPKVSGGGGGGGPRGGGNSLITRRQALIAGSSVVVAGALAACGNAKAPGQTTASSSGGGNPKRGGTLKIGMISGGPGELVIPSLAGLPDVQRTNLLYDPLFRLGPDLRTSMPALALSAEPSKNAKVWTFKLRPGVHWHDGKPFTAADVVWTIKSWQSPKSQTFGGYNSIVDFAGVRARGVHTVEVPMVTAVGDFPSFINTDTSAYIVQAGSTPHSLEQHPIGTGPFKFSSFTPGAQSVFVRNDDYWQHGKPYLDQVVVVTSFTDDDSRLNAFLAKDIDVLPFVSPLQAKQVTQSGRLLQSHSPNPEVFYLDIKRPPFSDVRVRQALKLLVDRQAMIDGALAGYAVPGNDLLGAGAQFFASDLKPERDVEKAKSLLKAAGQSDLSLTLSTANAYSGFNSAATLFAEQAAQGGVKISPKVGSPATYYAPTSGYPYTFGLDLLQPRGGLGSYYAQAYKQYDETRWGLDAHMVAAIGAQPQSESLWRQVQETQFNEGGYIVWAQQDNLDALASNVNGIPASPVGPLSGFDITGAYLD